nr:reverse transcriptase domain-containing protein [Tanacetum cinerariifolium]
MLEDPYVEVALQAPPSPYYIPGPEEPKQAPPSPDYVSGPEHVDDEIVAKDQLYVEDASPIAQSPKYVLESDFEAHPEDDDDEDPAEDLVDYLADGGDDGDDEESEPFETDESAATPPPHPAYRMTARISIPAPVPVPAWTDSEIVRLLAISSPPASPLSLWSSPPPQILFPPLPPILSPPSHKRLGIALGPRYKVGESSSAAAARPAGGLRADYGFGAPVSTDMELGGYMREFETRVRQDTDEIYMRLDDEQTERHLLAGRLNMLFRDRRAHAYTRHLMETEARMSREAWVRSTDASDLVRELLKTDHRRSIEITELRTALQGQVTALQAQVTALQGQQGLAGGPIQPELPEEADQETINATSVTNAQLQAMIDQGVTAALAARDALRSTNGDDSHNSKTGVRRTERATRESRDALRSTNGDDSHNSKTGVRRTERATRECTYIEFLKCQPLPFKGTEGVASLSQWCERMESVFHISNCAVENQVKFATCTLHSVALTWWNTHVQTVGHEAAYGMSWKMLMKMMTEKYCPRNKIKKLEVELWDLKVKGTNLASYTQRYQDLGLLCGRMFFEEFDKIEKYIGGLPDMIPGSVVASKPKTMQEAIEIATELMDKKIRTFAERETASKRKFENTSRNTQNQQQQSNKR